MAFREIAEQAWKIPDRFVEQRYTSVMHGVGMHGETPFIAHAIDYATYGKDGHLESGMVVSVESYIGEKGGREGEQGEALLIATNLMDLPAETIALIYRRRWTIELFFRFFKHILGCRHLLSHRANGIQIQVYMA